MAKRRSLFNLVKKLFFWESHPKQEKREKRKKWIFGKVKARRLASLEARPPSNGRTSLAEAEEEQSKHALTVAIASAAAAEAAVTAAQVAAEVVRLTCAESTIQCKEKEEEFQCIKSEDEAPQWIWLCQRENKESVPIKIRETAASKIQTAFRGYLARKALRALKGIVKLQAIIRGRAVRLQALSTLKCLQSIVNIQSQVCAKRSQTVEGRWKCEQNDETQSLKDKIIRIDLNSERRWDDSILTKEEADASYFSKKEAVLKRERIKEYWFSHRKSAESDRSKVNGRWRYWLEQWVDTQLTKSKELEDLDSVFSSNSEATEEFGGRQLKLRNLQRQSHIEGFDSPVRKSSHHRRQCSLGDNNSLLSSPALPTYMAATESAKAKVRSTSSPKLRPGNLESYSESNSPCKHKLSLASPINRETPGNGKLGKPIHCQQKSPTLKGITGPVKSSKITKDLSFNSDCSLPNWDPNIGFR